MAVRWKDTQSEEAALARTQAVPIVKAAGDGDETWATLVNIFGLLIAGDIPDISATYALASHTHAAADITSGTLAHERGGLEADVSAYDGLVKISGGATSAVTVTAFAETLLDDASAAAARATLDVDQAGTDNSTPVTLSGTGTYLTLVGQDIQVDPITESDIEDLQSYLLASDIDTLAELNAIVGDATLDDSSDSRPPSGAAGGDLSGTYPNPTVDVSAVAFIVRLAVRNATAGTLTKGTPVYQTGWNVGTGEITVDSADADTSATMPAVGLIESDVGAGSSGNVISFGPLEDVDTSSFSGQDSLYVANGGGLTATKPIADDQRQKVGSVSRSHAVNGVIFISGANRTNDIPNFTAADGFWYGGTGGVATQGTVTAFARTVLDDADAATARGTLDVDQAGTDNSTDVTLSGTGTYLTLVGQDIQVDPITESDISDLGTSVAMVADNLSVFAATTSAQLAGVISDETGTGALVFANSPTLVTPALGTPASGDLQNCTETTPTTKGVIELATQAEVDAGTDTTRAVTPDTLSNYSGLGGGLTQEAVSADADKAMAVNTEYSVDMSGWASDNIFSLPTTAAVGDRVRINLKAGNASFEMQLRTTSGSSDTINNVDHSSSDWSKLFIDNESIEFTCVQANTGWIVSHDGRILCLGHMTISSPQSAWSAATFTKLQWTTAVTNRGSVCDTANNEFSMRRDGFMEIVARVETTSMSDGENIVLAYYKNGVEVARGPSQRVGNTGAGSAGIAVFDPIADDDDIELWIFTTSSEQQSATASRTYVQLKEVL